MGGAQPRMYKEDGKPAAVFGRRAAVHLHRLRGRHPVLRPAALGAVTRDEASLRVIDILTWERSQDNSRIRIRRATDGFIDAGRGDRV